MSTPLKYMREEFRKLQWALYLVIIAFVVLIFAAWGGGGKIGSGQLTGDVVVRVGDTGISGQEFYKAYRRQVDLYRQIYGEQFSPELLKNFNLPGQVVNQIVERELLSKQAVKSGIQISDEDVFQEIIKIDVFKKENGDFVGKERYDRILAANRMSTDTFEADLRKDLLVQKYRQLLKDSLLVSESEVREEYMKQNVQAKVDYLYVQDTVFESRVTVAEEDLTLYFEENRDDFFRPEQRKVTYLLADLVKIKPTIPVDNEEIKAYYESHKEEYQQEEEVSARHILIKSESRSDEETLKRIRQVKKEIDAGLEFTEAAKKYSEDPSNARTGGGLGSFGKGRMVPPFEEVAFSMKVGTISDPVKTSFGYHLIQKLGHNKEGLKPLNEVEFVIRDLLSRNRADKAAELKAQEFYASLAGKDTVTDDELRAIADEDPLIAFNTTDLFAEGDTVPGIGKNDDFMSVVFAKEMSEGNISAPIKLGRGYAVVHLSAVQEEGVPPLEEMKDQVTAKVKLELAHKKGFDRLLEMLSSGTSMENLARAFNVQVKKDETIRYLSPVPALGSTRILHETVANVEPGVLTDPIEVKNGWAIFLVNSRDDFVLEELKKSEPEIRDRLKDQQVTTIIRASIEELKKKEKIFINQDYLNQLS